MDAILEEYNKLVKSWMCGESFNSGTWRSVIRNVEKLVQLRNKVSSLAHCTVFIFCGLCCFPVLSFPLSVLYFLLFGVVSL